MKPLQERKRLRLQVYLLRNTIQYRFFIPSKIYLWKGFSLKIQTAQFLERFVIYL